MMPRTAQRRGERVTTNVVGQVASRLLALMLVLAACLPLPAAGQAVKREQITAYDIDITIEASGALLVTESIAYYFAEPRHGILRDIPVRLRYDGTFDRVYPLEVVSVDATGGASDDYTVEESGGMKRIRIGDPDRTISGGYGYSIRYRVRGALNAFPEHDELY
jgi:hypothetical protein